MSPMQTRFGLFGAARVAVAARYAVAVALVGGGTIAISLYRGRDPWIFGAIGLLLSALLFRSLLRPLSWPRVLLTRDSLLLVRRNRNALAIPWDAITSIAPDGEAVMLTFAQPLEFPGEGYLEGIGLEAAKLRTAPEALSEALRQAKEHRAELPATAEAQPSL